MRIAVIGSGSVGGRLGRLWANLGHDVQFGVRDPQSAKAQAARAAGGDITTIADAVAAAEVVVMAVPLEAIESVVAAGGDWDGKIVADATNRLSTHPNPENLNSSGEEIAARAAGARVVKAFNYLGANRYAHPKFGEEAASILICGDDDEAKEVVGGLVRELDFDVVDAGALSTAPLLESLAELWVTVTRAGYGRDIAFRLLRESDPVS